jgi:hypothetical protein
MSLLPFFQWCYFTPVGEGIRNSTWLFPVIEAVHLLALGLTAGSVLIVALRLMGAGLVKQPVAQIASNAQPWLIAGVAVMFASGFPLFLSESIKCYYSFAFWIKMTSLLLALVFTFTIQRRVTQSDLSDQPLISKLTGLISLVLWFGVAFGGRWIGFS